MIGRQEDQRTETRGGRPAQSVQRGPPGAVAGGTTGYLYDKSKKNEQQAYEKGVKDAQSGKSK